MKFWKSLLVWLTGREPQSAVPQVAVLIGEFNKKREELIAAADKLRALVAARQEEAEALLARARAHQDDADWAQRVADRVAALIK